MGKFSLKHFFKDNEIIITFLAITFIQPNFDDFFYLKNSSKQIVINLNDLSFIFILICYMVISIIVFIKIF